MSDLTAHPYADAFPMLPDTDLVELAESIRTNGLRNPIVVTPSRQILDGRNRYAACEMAEVEPTVVVYEGDDLAEYVIDCNTTRRHMTTGQRAMSTALVLAADGRRGDGRWKRGSVPVDNRESSVSDGWEQALRQAGVILDHAPDLAQLVVDGELTLNAAYEAAKSNKDAADAARAAEAEEALREQEARAELEQVDPDLFAEVNPDGLLKTYQEGMALYWQRNREEKQRREQEEADRRGQIQRTKDYVMSFLQGYYAAANLGDNPLRDDVLALMPPTHRDKFLTIEKEMQTWPTMP